MNIEDYNKNITIRFAIVALLAAILIIPTLLIGALVSDRWQFFREAIMEIKDTWSSGQVLIGPTIIVPVADDDGDERQFQRVAFMPQSLDVNIESTHQFRTRTIFTTPVLEFQLTAKGHFPPLPIDEVWKQHKHVFVEQSLLSFALSDVRGIKNVKMIFSGQELDVDVSETGNGKSLNARFPEEELLEVMEVLRSGGPFEFSASLRASDGIHVVPHGDTSSIRIAGTWPHPKFDGDMLPDTREVTEDGFEAKWHANAISVGFKRKLYLPGEGITHRGEMVGAWREAVRPLDLMLRSGPRSNENWNVKSMDPFGEDLIQVGFTVIDPITPYRKISRTVNYGILFIILTFGAILCIELVTSVQFHFVQYFVIGTALVIFFLTLLSIAEHLGFGTAYLIAAAMMTAMLTSYTHFSAKNNLITLAMLALLVLLYGVLFLILELVNYSLLVGTGLLLLLLGVLMWATRNLTVTKDSATD